MQAYKNALQVQDACNLSGVVKSFAKDFDAVWSEARELGKGTDYVNTHPVCRLYLEQIAHLVCGGNLDFTSYYDAAEACKEKVKED
jgi:hypothetical protein